jgi:hypothetical protein
MKGIVFTEFIEMVETEFSPEIADEIIDAADLSTGGAYTSVGTYDHNELVRMVVALSQETNVEIPELIKAFGCYLFGRFLTLYPDFFDHVGNSFDFLDRIDNYVHVEVKKLYPDAELPSFETSRTDSSTLIMHDKSSRPFAHLAEGLISGAIEHFNENIDVMINDHSGGQNTNVEFVLHLN